MESHVVKGAAVALKSVVSELQELPPENRFRLVSRETGKKMVTVPIDEADVNGHWWLLRHNPDGGTEVIAAFISKKEGESVLQQVVYDAAIRIRAMQVEVVERKDGK